LALQVLFLWDAQGAPDSDIADRIVRSGLGIDSGTPGAAPATLRNAETLATEVDPATRSDALDMARGAWLERDQTDKRLEFHAPQWPPKRQPAVDRAILRLAVWELGHTSTPPKAVLDEAIELSRLYSTEQSPAFVNGVLDAILKENQGLTAPPAPLPTSPIAGPLSSAPSPGGV
jgi:N utilization substance protein B